MTTRVSSSVLANTAVTAGTYGGSTQQAVVTVDAQGRLTLAANATPSIANSQITGVITASQLAATTVTAGTYGGGLAVPVVIVDQQGRLTSAANVTITQTAVYGNTNQITANTATGTVALGLASTTVTPATYGGAATSKYITVDQQGRITSAANIAISITKSQVSDFPTLATSATTDTTNASNITSGTLPDARHSTLYNPVGVGQTWQSPTRAFGTTYTNSTGRPIFVVICVTPPGVNGYVNVIVQGVTIAILGVTSAAQSVVPATACFIVPDGATYSSSVASGSTPGLQYWKELR